MYTLVFNNKNRVICILNYINKLLTCAKCSYITSSKYDYYYPCKSCLKIEHDICKLMSALSTSYRRLLSWLARLPFTRLKTIDQFRNEINSEMKNLFKLYRKRFKIDNFYETLKQSVS